MDQEIIPSESVIIPPEILQLIETLQKEKPTEIIRNGKGRIVVPIAQDTNKYGTAGRPPADEKYILQKLREAFLMGCTDEEACLWANISPRWLYNFQKENPEYLQEKEVLKQHPKMLARRNIYGALNLGYVDNSEWYLEHKANDEFSKRVKQDVTNPDAVDEILDKMESRTKKTDYGELANTAKSAMEAARKASEQMVATNPPVQDQG